jgi:hypothetical protein
MDEPAVPGRPFRRARDDEKIRLVRVQTELSCGTDVWLREGDASIDVAIAHGPVLEEHFAKEQAARGRADGFKRLNCRWTFGRGWPSGGSQSERGEKPAEGKEWDLAVHGEYLLDR